MTTRRTALIVLLVGLVLTPLAGCGPSPPGRNRVFGRATYDGKPIEKGEIEFYPIEGTAGPSSGVKIYDGKYDVLQEKGPFAGKYRVHVYGFHKTGRKVPNLGGEMIDHWDNFLPPKYWEDESELRAEIKDGDNEIDFLLDK